MWGDMGWVQVGGAARGWHPAARLTRFSSHPQQLNAIIAASMSLKSSSKLRNILEVRSLGCGGPDGGTGARRVLPVSVGTVPTLGCPICAGSCPQAVVSLQIVLAFGNYMNSSKRGAAYGFRLQSLDAVGSAQGCPVCWCTGALSLPGDQLRGWYRDQL